jgi:hypothetical protein
LRQQKYARHGKKNKKRRKQFATECEKLVGEEF